MADPGKQRRFQSGLEMKPLEQRRRLGRGVTAPAILGCGSVGGIGSAPAGLGSGLDRAAAFEVFDTAVDLGINVFDTADGYAGGESERAIGAWLAERDVDVTVETKVGVAFDKPSLRDLSPERIASHARTSLQRLGLDRIEMYMAHAPDSATPIVDSLKAFDDLYQQGLIGSLGLCNADVAALEEWAAESERHSAIPVSWIQNEYNLLTRSDDDDVLPYCQQAGLGYTAYSPLAGGILTDRYRPDQPAPLGSRISALPEQYGQRFDASVFAGVRAMAEYASQLGVDCATLALAWVMSHPAITAPLVAPKSPRQFDSVVEAAALSLSAAQRDELAVLFPC